MAFGEVSGREGPGGFDSHIQQFQLDHTETGRLARKHVGEAVLLHGLEVPPVEDGSLQETQRLCEQIYTVVKEKTS